MAYGIRYTVRSKEYVGFPMHNTPYNERLKSLRKRLRVGPFDAIWIVQPENRRYLSGFRAADTQLNESSGSLLINNRKALLITDSRYSVQVSKEAPDFEVVTQRGDVKDELIRQLICLRTKRLGFEENHLIWNIHNQLLKMLNKLSPPVKLVPSKGMVEEMRIIKDPAEIRIMKRASDIMSKVLSETIKDLQPGKREIEIAREIENRALKAGADALAFDLIVASGPNAALPHAVPTKRKIRRNEPIIFDVGVKVEGYCCDMTRTVFLDNPKPLFRKIYRTVRRAQQAAMEYVRPGELSTKPDSIARDIIREAGFGDYFGHSLGHGVGLATHEAPSLSPRNPVRLEEGMVVTVEPGIYIPGKGGVRLEEMVVIEKNGPRILTENDHYYDF